MFRGIVASAATLSLLSGSIQEDLAFANHVSPQMSQSDLLSAADFKAHAVAFVDQL